MLALAWWWGGVLLCFTVPTGVFVVQVLVARFGVRQVHAGVADPAGADPVTSNPPRVAVLIPAHN